MKRHSFSTLLADKPYIMRTVFLSFTNNDLSVDNGLFPLLFSSHTVQACQKCNIKLINNAESTTDLGPSLAIS